MVPVDFDLYETQLATLARALAGVITPNFRMVTLLKQRQCWIVEIVLERESAEDLEEIEDLVVEYFALQLNSSNFDHDIITRVSRERLEDPQPPARKVFRRKENEFGEAV